MYSKFQNEILPSLIWKWKSYPRNAGKYSILMQFYHIWHEKISTMGRLLILLTLVATLLEFLPGITPLLLWIGLALLSLGMASVLTRKVKNIDVYLNLPSTVYAQEQTQIKTTVQSFQQKTIYAFRLKWFRLPDHVSSQAYDYEWHELKSLESFATKIPLQFSRRGIFNIPFPTLLKSEPLGLVHKRFRKKELQTIFVFPQKVALKQFPQFKKKLRQTYPNIKSLMGQKDKLEFSHTQEYHLGDDFKNVHHKSWAKRGKPVVKVSQSKKNNPKINFYIDLQKVDRIHQRLIEPMLSLACTLLDFWYQNGYEVVLFLVEGSVKNHLEQKKALCSLKWNHQITLPHLPKNTVVLGVADNEELSYFKDHYRLQLKKQNQKKYYELYDPNYWKDWIR